MAKQRYVNTRFWDDGYICSLDPSEKLLFLYFLTNSATNISGVYEIPLKRISVDTGFDIDMCKKIIERFERDKKIIYKDNWVVMLNFLRHQNTSSKLVRKGIADNIKQAPQWVIPYIYYIDTILHLNLNLNLDSNLNLDLNLDTLHDFFEEKNHGENEQKPQESKKEQELPQEIIDLTQYFYDLIMRYVEPPRYKNKAPNLMTWAIEIEKLHRIDGQQIDVIKKVMEFTVKDKFWRTNVLSGKKFREQFNTLYLKMNTGGNRIKDVHAEVDRFNKKVEEIKRRKEGLS